MKSWPLGFLFSDEFQRWSEFSSVFCFVFFLNFLSLTFFFFRHHRVELGHLRWPIGQSTIGRAVFLLILPPFFIDYSSTIQRVTIRFSGLTSVIIVVVIIITATADADDRDEDYYCEPFPVARRPSFFCLLLLKTKKKIKDNKKRNSQQSCQPTVSSPVESIKGEFGCWAATAAEPASVGGPIHFHPPIASYPTDFSNE